MVRVIVVALLLALIPVYAADPTQQILALERQAMDGWLKGDPDPQLSATDSDIIFIHDVIQKRLEGRAAVKELYERYRGTPLFDSYEILNPMVRLAGDAAVLTYQLAQIRGGVTRYWNGTQVYQKKPEGWRVIHTHWSEAKGQ